MKKFIDLDRRFRELTDKELEDPEDLVRFEEYGFGLSIGWSELLEHPRVILLAEAGSGKTMEMEEQAKSLVENGQYAFFVALESLNDEPFVDLLSSGELSLFEAWKAEGRQAGWFFLDSVDELKLRKGKFSQALRHFSHAVDGYLSRTRVIISCRPSDWLIDNDPSTVLKWLPIPETGGDAWSPDELFIEAPRLDIGVTNTVAHEGVNRADKGIVLKLQMLPMTKNQITLYAKKSAVENVTRFLEEIDRQNAWIFARRPLDLDELIDIWNSLGHLGTRIKQHEIHVSSKLMDQADRPDSGILSNVKAHIGAERLALALTLTRTRTIRTPDHAPDVHRIDGILEPSSILKSWTDEERRTLLRRALFDPATYGRVRFHHRSIQEYLAARYLWSLREKGMSDQALLRLLVTRLYGVDVVYPSMRAIAAWLSLWCDIVRKELIKREPETLLTYGDPDSLTVAARTALLRSFVTAYGQGGWRGLNIPTDDIRRFANPDLAPVIRECWSMKSENAEVQKLLLDIIWLGPVENCVDLAATVAHDPSQQPSHRVSAIRALIASNQGENVRIITNSILTMPASWPDKVVYSLATELFPKFISAEELVTLMELRHEPQQTAHNFEWVSRQIAESIEPLQEAAITLRNKMADLIWRGRKQDLEFYDIRSKFDHIAPALAILCDRQLSQISTKNDTDLIRACVIASRFSAGKTAVHELITKLKVHFDGNLTLRNSIFLAEVEFIDQIMPDADDFLRYHFSQENSITGHLTEFDIPWLEKTLVDESRLKRRAVALHALIDLWYKRGKQVTELDSIRSTVQGDLKLELILKNRTKPNAPDKKVEQIQLQTQQQQEENDNHEAARLEGWRNWSDYLLTNPANAFSPDKQKQTISNIFFWLGEYKQVNSRYNIWDKNALIQEFNSDIADRAAIAFRSIWRTKQPRLWSERPADGRNSMTYDWIHGLLGVSAEAENPDWTDSLSAGEVRLAARYACIEMNGFASFISALALSHPKEVEEVVGGEVSAELSDGNDHYSLPTLQNLTHADVNIKQLLIPRLIVELKSWPCEFSDQAESRWLSHLERVLRVLEVANNEWEREAIVQECVRRYETNQGGISSLAWLRTIFEFDPLRGTRILIESLADNNDADTCERAIKTFAALFGDHDRIIFEIEDRTQQVFALEQLVRCAYTYIRPEDDQIHEGSYTPNTRDDAESARSFLLNRLLETPGHEAYCAVMTLADEVNFSHFPDRLQLLARERAADDAEFLPYGPEDVIALENSLETPPQDKDSLFDLMMERLEELADDYSHGEYSNRRTIQRISEEPEMQRTLAGQLQLKANGAYKVTREEAVADDNKTDIRLLSIIGNQKAVIEVKIADNRWSLSDLLKALREQLVGKYLRDANCKAGCLLLTNHDKKKFWIHPDTRCRIYFSELIAFLNEMAAALEEEKLHTIRISVFGLDLTEPT